MKWTPLKIKLYSIGLILCLGLIIYSHTFHSPFTLDDSLFIQSNESLKDVHDFFDIWNYYPSRFLTLYSLALNYHFGQLNVL